MLGLFWGRGRRKKCDWRIGGGTQEDRRELGLGLNFWWRVGDSDSNSNSKQLWCIGTYRFVGAKTVFGEMSRDDLTRVFI